MDRAVHSSSHLNKDREVDDGDRRRDEHLLERNDLFVDEEDESKGDRSPKASVRHDELLNFVQLVQPKSVHDRREDYDTCAN